MPGRRPAMYWYKSRRVAGGQADIFAEEERDELPLVNRLRVDLATLASLRVSRRE